MTFTITPQILTWRTSPKMEISLAQRWKLQRKTLEPGVRTDCRSITSTIKDFVYSQDSQTECTPNIDVEKCGPESHYNNL